MTPEEALNRVGVDVGSPRHEKAIHKAMDIYSEQIATSFAKFISKEGWSKIVDSDQWIKISNPHPSFMIDEVYRFFLNHNNY